MSLKKFITFTAAIATCLTAPLCATEVNFSEIESTLPTPIATSIRNLAIAASNLDTRRIIDNCLPFQDKLTDFTKEYFKNYAINYLSNTELLQFNNSPTISREELHNLLVNYMNARCYLAFNVENIDIRLFDMLNNILSPDVTTEPFGKFPHFAAKFISTWIYDYIEKAVIQGNMSYVTRSRSTEDTTNINENACESTTPNAQGIHNIDHFAPLKTRAINYVNLVIFQDCNYHYCQTNSTSSTSRYVAFKIMEQCFCDFFMPKIFTDELQLNYTTKVTQLSNNNFTIRNEYSIDLDNFDLVFNSAITQLVGEDIVNTAERNGTLNQLKRRVKISAERQVKSFHEDCFFEIVALWNPDDDVSLESLVNIFNKGLIEETATPEQIESLIRRWSSLI